jgi:hypothetical protein
VPGDTIGYLPCPWCQALFDRAALATVRTNSKGNAFVVCEGGPDGSQVSCGQGNNLHARHSARLKAMLARAARDAPEPHSTVELPEPADPSSSQDSHDDDHPAGDPPEPDSEPGPEPEPVKRRSRFGLI